MIDVPIDELSRAVNAAAADTKRSISCELESNGGHGQTLWVRPPSGKGVGILLTVLEPGTLYFELTTGHRTDWIVRDEKELVVALDELRKMAGAVFSGQVSRRGTLTTPAGRRFRLAGPSGPLQAFSSRVRGVESYPAAD